MPAVPRGAAGRKVSIFTRRRTFAVSQYFYNKNLLLKHGNGNNYRWICRDYRSIHVKLGRELCDLYSFLTLSFKSEKLQSKSIQ